MLVTEKPRVASVTVAWNGARIISRHLQSLRLQTTPLAEIIVVDNASSDATVVLLSRTFPEVTILQLEENVGVGGGFAAGLEYALSKNYEWFWLFDQDSIADASALDRLLSALDVLSEEQEKIGILASLLADPDTGMEYLGELWRDRLIKVPQEQVLSPVLFVDSVMSCGSLIRRSALERVGLPRSDFFMDWVDNEFNLRMRHKGFQIVQVRASLVYHRLGEIQHVISFFKRKRAVRLVEPSWRHYFLARNETFTCWHLFGTAKSRFFLLLRLLRRTASHIWHEQRGVENLRMIWAGFWDGYTRNLGRPGVPGPQGNGMRDRVEIRSEHT
jgi:GT2 family glycosyltransferase